MKHEINNEGEILDDSSMLKQIGYSQAGVSTKPA